MSTATFRAPTQGAFVMNQPSTRLEDTRPDLQEIINNLLALKLMAKDGILTHSTARFSAKATARTRKGSHPERACSRGAYERPANLNTPSPSNEGVLRFDVQGKPENFNR